MNCTYPNVNFAVSVNTQGGPRRGKITTLHGVVETPAFIFCATKASIKGLSPQLMRQAGTQIILSNTYHLMLQPGGEAVAQLGGLQRMTGWQGPMLTDSGGFQVFSLGHGSVASEIKGNRTQSAPQTLIKLTEEGAHFRAYTNGKRELLTPERSIQTQQSLGADLIVVFDECTPFNVPKEYTRESMRRSHRWALRSLREFQKKHNGTQALYGIVQGGIYEDMRQESTDFVNTHPFFGHAVGGSLGAHKNQMYDVVSYTLDRLRRDRPVHLLGIGGVRDIFNGVRCGVDTFDCVHPTRLARHGGALLRADQRTATDTFTKEHIDLRQAKYRLDDVPLDPFTADPFLKEFSRGYVHHLLQAGEFLGHQIITYHNVKFMNDLMTDIRYGIETGTLDGVEAKWIGGIG
ncbi:MAG: tRNA guanosine(34) transglycosylase Tgt [Alphaproteobacteria bacterium]|nr:MAG: tRNA guanosine(34) transglycosylase Tgt [Alphaproteobacteria bacterium]